MTRYNEALLRPLVEELAETRRRLEALANDNGRLQAELSQAREQLALMAPREVELDDLTPPTGQQLDHLTVAPAPEPPRGRWGRLMAWLYG